MKASDNTYLFRIDHLRFFAAFLVIVWHFSHLPGYLPISYVPKNLFLNIFEEGHTGVALFMVISGFIFEYVSFGKEIIYSKFIYNRILRIFPLFILFTLFAIYNKHLTNASDIAINMVTFISPKDLPDVGWTIAVEFQFYLIFPFLHSMLTKKGPGHLFFILIFFFALRVIAFQILYTVQDLSYWTIFGRIDQFLIGILMSYFYRKYMSDRFSNMKITYRYLFSSILLIASFTAISLFYKYFNELGGYSNDPAVSKSSIWIYLPTVEGLCYSLFLLGYLLFPNNYLKYYDLLLGKLGELSYSMYWIHLAITWVVFNWGIGSNDFTTVLLYAVFIVTPIVVGLSLISYNFIEKPFLEKRVKYHD